MNNEECLVSSTYPVKYRCVYDFQICHGQLALREAIDYINRHGYDLVSVSQREQTYTVFFRRWVFG